MTGFMPRSVHVEFVVDKVALGQVSFRVLWFFLVSIIPTWLFILIYHWGMNNRPAGGHSSETYSKPIDMKVNNKWLQLLFSLVTSNCLCELDTS
jgi:hypothetical protein